MAESDSTDTDDHVLDQMRAMLENADEDELKRFCSGTLKAATLGQRVFKRRFPESWANWDGHIEEHGRVPE